MIAINRTGMNMHIMCYRYLPQQFPATQANVPAQNFISVLRRPNQMVFAVPNRMTATLVKLHKWMLRIPSPKGEGFTDPLTGTVNSVALWKRIVITVPTRVRNPLSFKPPYPERPTSAHEHRIPDPLPIAQSAQEAVFSNWRPTKIPR